jgi:hypothetical protein
MVWFKKGSGGSMRLMVLIVPVLMLAACGAYPQQVSGSVSNFEGVCDSLQGSVQIASTVKPFRLDLKSRFFWDYTTAFDGPGYSVKIIGECIKGSNTTTFDQVFSGSGEILIWEISVEDRANPKLKFYGS